MIFFPKTKVAWAAQKLLSRGGGVLLVTPEGTHCSVTSGVAPCEQQGATKKHEMENLVSLNSLIGCWQLALSHNKNPWKSLVTYITRAQFEHKNRRYDFWQLQDKKQDKSVNARRVALGLPQSHEFCCRFVWFFFFVCLFFFNSKLHKNLGILNDTNKPIRIIPKRGKNTQPQKTRSHCQTWCGMHVPCLAAVLSSS